MHVHLPTGDWVCGCVGHYADSIERYFGSRPETHVGRGAYRAVRAAGPRGRAARVGRAGQDARQRGDRVDLRGSRAGGSSGSAASTRTARMRWRGWRASPRWGCGGSSSTPRCRRFDPGDDRFLPFFDAAAELGLILLTHAGTSGLGAGEPGGQGLRIDLARPILLDRIAARHPGMQIVLAHVGWPWHLEAVAMALHKSNVYLDISGWKYRYLPDEVKREIPRRLRDQFCFGTDYPMFDPEACLAELDRLELPPERRERRPARQRRRAARPVAEHRQPDEPRDTGPRPASSSAGCATEHAEEHAAGPSAPSSAVLRAAL